MSNQANQISQKLHSLKLADFMTTHEVVSVKADEPVENAVRTMGKHNIHAVPVMDGTTCLGVIDMLDVIRHANVVSPVSQDSRSLEIAGRALALKSVRDLVNASGRDPLAPLEVDEYANLAVNYFASGIHRAPILNKEDQIVGSVSQSDLVHWFHDQSETYLKKMEVLQKPVTSLGLGCGPVTKVRDDQTVLDAIRVLDQTGVSAVPIVDEENQFVGNFSATDLKGMYWEKWPSFFLPVREFLDKHSPQSLNGEGLPVSGTTLFDVLAWFRKYPYHRVWMLHQGMPVGVVSHTDIMKFMRDWKDNVATTEA